MPSYNYLSLSRRRDRIECCCTAAVWGFRWSHFSAIISCCTFEACLFKPMCQAKLRPKPPRRSPGVYYYYYYYHHLWCVVTWRLFTYVSRKARTLESGCSSPFEALALTISALAAERIHPHRRLYATATFQTPFYNINPHVLNCRTYAKEHTPCYAANPHITLETPHYSTQMMP